MIGCEMKKFLYFEDLTTRTLTRTPRTTTFVLAVGNAFPRSTKAVRFAGYTASVMHSELSNTAMVRCSPSNALYLRSRRHE